MAHHANKNSTNKKRQVLVAQVRSNKIAVRAHPFLALARATIGHGGYYAAFTYGPHALPPHS